MNEQFDRTVRAELAKYGVTDVTIIHYDGDRPMVTILTGDTDRIDVADMIATDILRPGPVWMDMNCHGAGVELKHADWPGRSGGAMFVGYISNRRARARYNLDMGRASAANVNSLDPIKADGMLDLAYAAYEHELRLADDEERVAA